MVSSMALHNVQKRFPEVTSVKDATKPVTISITSQDIVSSRRRSHKHCAAAVACKRMLPVDGVLMSVETAYLVKGRKAIRYRIPGRIQREIVAFDKGGRFEPGEYELRVWDKHHSLGTLGRHRGERQRRRKIRHHHTTVGVRAALR